MCGVVNGLGYILVGGTVRAFWSCGCPLRLFVLAMVLQRSRKRSGDVISILSSIGIDIGAEHLFDRFRFTCFRVHIFS